MKTRFMWSAASLLVCMGCGKKDAPIQEVEVKKPVIEVEAKQLTTKHASIEAFCQANTYLICEEQTHLQSGAKLASGERVVAMQALVRTEEGFSIVVFLGKSGELYEVGPAVSWTDEEELDMRYLTFGGPTDEYGPEGFFTLDHKSGIKSEVDGGIKHTFTRTTQACSFHNDGLACAPFVVETGYSFEDSEQAASIAMLAFAKVDGEPGRVDLSPVWGTPPEGVDLTTLTTPGSYKVTLP